MWLPDSIFGNIFKFHSVVFAKWIRLYFQVSFGAIKDVEQSWQEKLINAGWLYSHTLAPCRAFSFSRDQAGSTRMT